MTEHNNPASDPIGTVRDFPEWPPPSYDTYGPHDAIKWTDDPHETHPWLLLGSDGPQRLGHENVANCPIVARLERAAELAKLRASREAWAIEADRLDVIATEACLVTHPRECGRDESDCTNDDSCPRAEERYATADDLLGAMALSEEVAQLTRERDDAREELTSFYSTTRGLAGMFWADPEDHQALDALSDIRRQLAAWRADATQVPEGWQSLVRKGWSVGARPAIPADAAYVESLKDDLALAGDEASAFRNLLSSIWLYVSWRSVTKRLTTEQKELWADAIEASGDPDEPTEVDRWWRDVAPMSGSDTATEDGEDDWGKDRLLQGPASPSGRDGGDRG